MLAPLLRRVEAHVFAAERLHGDDTTPASVISPLALEAVRRIDALFEIERAINGQSTERRREVRQELSAPLVADLERWLREERPKLSRHAETAKAIDYMLKRWPAFTRFLDDGRICLSNNAAERALRGIALGEPWAENHGCSRVPIARPAGDPWRTARRGDLQPDRHRQTERCRSAGLAGRCPGPHRRASGPPDR